MFSIILQTTSWDPTIPIGHIPLQIFMHRPQRSPLAQGGLEIPIELTVSWTDIVKLDILREKLLSVNFTEYVDESAEILETMGVPAANDNVVNIQINLHENVDSAVSDPESSLRFRFR